MPEITPVRNGSFFQLVSLWDMIQFNLSAYTKIVKLLGNIEAVMRTSTERLAKMSKLSEQISDMEVQNPSELNDEWKSLKREASREWAAFCKPVEDLMLDIEISCLELELLSPPAKIKRIREKLSQGVSQAENALSSFGDIGERIEDELETKLFMTVPASKAWYFTEKDLLGADVAAKFTDAETIEDTEEAGKCYALGRYTACVFHLMRVMERAVHLFANEFPGITINPGDTWNDILQRIDPRIRSMPTGTVPEQDKQLAYRSIYTSLHAVRAAWRNPTMHPKNTYTPEEAKEIFDCVKAFMHNIAKSL
jgi:hypothetical protein